MIDHGPLARRCQAAADSADKIKQLSDDLGVSIQSLRRLGVGWSVAEGCWTFPLCDGTGTKAVGVNRRFTDGSKRVIAGHHIGLYVPADLPADLTEQVILLVEGGSDTTTGLDLGYWTVGRFSCQTGKDQLRTLIQARRPRLTVICADTGNEHERKGASNLAISLALHCRSLKVVQPPHAYKDLRAWRNAGATRADLNQLIESAPSFCVGVKT